jgi:hypothetical protein
MQGKGKRWGCVADSQGPHGSEIGGGLVVSRPAG